MADTIREKIVDQIEARFTTITTGNGYRTSIGDKVSVWRDNPFEPGDVGLDIRDMGGPIEQKLANVHEQTLNIEVDVVTAGSTTATNVRKMIADVYQAIGTDRKWNDGSQDLARNTMLTDDAMQISHAGKRVGGATIKFQVIYRTDEFDAETRA